MVYNAVCFDLIKSIPLCVVGLVVIVIPLVTNEGETWNADIVEGCVVAAVIALRPRLYQLQILERRQRCVDYLACRVILVESYRKDSRSASVIRKYGRNLVPLSLLLFQV